MSISIRIEKARRIQEAEMEAADSDARRDGAFTRIRAAILKEQATPSVVNEQDTGSDPYNSGVHRALAKAHTWDKRSR